jgi:hypothetical protein
MAYSIRVESEIVEIEGVDREIFNVVETDHLTGSVSVFPNYYTTREEADAAIRDYLLPNGDDEGGRVMFNPTSTLCADFVAASFSHSVQCAVTDENNGLYGDCADHEERHAAFLAELRVEDRFLMAYTGALPSEVWS